MAEQQFPSYCAQCISRCGCLVTVNDGKLTKVQNLAEHPTGNGVCRKGKAAPQIVYHPDRVLTPMQRTQPKGADDPLWQPISWQQAYATIEQKLNQFKAESGAQSVCWGITTPSATAIADSFMWINRLAHSFGSPNKLFATENCNWHKDFTHAHVHGQGIGMPDYQHTDCMIMWGFNPKDTWPAQASQVALAQKKGAKLIVVDPRKAGLATGCDLWMPVTPGTDGVLAMALANWLITHQAYDKNFVSHWSNGPLLVRDDNGKFLCAQDLTSEANPLAGHGNIEGKSETEQLIAWNETTQIPVLYDVNSKKYICPAVDEVEFALKGSIEIDGVKCRPAFAHYQQACQIYSLEYAAEVTGIAVGDIEQMAQMIANSNAVSYFGWTGTAQHQQATETTIAIASLYGLTGCLDKQGGNVYFAKPAVANLMGLSLLKNEQRQQALGADKPLGPHKMGWVNSNDLYQSVVHQTPYKTRALVAFGGNPIATKPDETRVRRSLQELEFYVHADLFMNESAKEADIFLPVSSSWERSGVNPGFLVSQQAESLLQLRKPLIKPLGDSKPDTNIVFELATLLGLGQDFFNGNIDEAVAEVIAPTGVTLAELKQQPKGVDLGLQTQYKKYRQQGFNTPTGKVELYSETLLKSGYPPTPQFNELAPDGDYPYILTSAKFRAQSHSQHKNVAMLNRHGSEPMVEISAKLAKKLMVENGDKVMLETPIGTMLAIAKLNRDIAEPVLCVQYGWQNKGMNFNGVVEQEPTDPISGSNQLKRQRCKVSQWSGTSSNLSIKSVSKLTSPSKLAPQFKSKLTPTMTLGSMVQKPN